ncbi:hypothetical protein EDB84DRAFT_784458 [Lactarius hengduanensis]|nr:hypothetical protein EDB84DRAFT_784458 [Lactarius hengduanensis]
MVCTLLSNRTQVRRTNTVLNLLAIYAVNCGILHLVFAISSVILFVKFPYTNLYTPSLFIMVRLSLCAFMSILNSRNNLRETLDGPGGVVSTFSSKGTHGYRSRGHARHNGGKQHDVRPARALGSELVCALSPSITSPTFYATFLTFFPTYWPCRR